MYTYVYVVINDYTPVCVATQLIHQFDKFDGAVQCVPPGPPYGTGWGVRGSSNQQQPSVKASSHWSMYAKISSEKSEKLRVDTIRR